MLTLCILLLFLKAPCLAQECVEGYFSINIDNTNQLATIAGIEKKIINQIDLNNDEKKEIIIQSDISLYGDFIVILEHDKNDCYREIFENYTIGVQILNSCIKELNHNGWPCLGHVQQENLPKPTGNDSPYPREAGYLKYRYSILRFAETGYEVIFSQIVNMSARNYKSKLKKMPKGTIIFDNPSDYTFPSPYPKNIFKKRKLVNTETSE